MTSASSDKQAFQLIESPCIGVCTLTADDVCQGCLRTVDEILNWVDYSHGQRLAVMTGLPARRAALMGSLSGEPADG